MALDCFGVEQILVHGAAGGIEPGTAVVEPLRVHQQLQPVWGQAVAGQRAVAGRDGIIKVVEQFGVRLGGPIGAQQQGGPEDVLDEEVPLALEGIGWRDALVEHHKALVGQRAQDLGQAGRPVVIGMLDVRPAQLRGRSL